MTTGREFLHGAELSGAIRQVLSNEPVRMAVAYWGRGAFARLGLNESGGVIACDAFSGSCNADALQELIDRGFRVVDVPGLHAKVYIGGEHMVVTSANASANGLGEEGEEIDLGLEAGSLVTDQDAVARAIAWFDTLVNEKPSLTSEDLARIRALHQERRKHRPLRVGRRSFLQVLLDAKSAFDGRGMFVTLYEGVPPPAADEAAYKKTPFYDPKSYDKSPVYPFFWGAHKWREVVSVDDVILSFEAEDGKIGYEGCWRVQALHSNGLVPVADAGLPLGLPLSRSDRKELLRLVRAAAKRGSLSIDGPLLTLEEFGAIVRATATVGDSSAQPERGRSLDRGDNFKHGFAEADWAAAKAQAVQAMTKRARRGQTMTYTDLCSEIEAIRFDPHDPRLPDFLGQISTEEDAAGRGMLTAVVVHKQDSQPGKGFYELARRLGRTVVDEESAWIAEINTLRELHR